MSVEIKRQYRYLQEFCETLAGTYQNVLNEKEHSLLNTLNKLQSRLGWHSICLLSRKHNFFSFSDETIAFSDLQELQFEGMVQSVDRTKVNCEILAAVSKKGLLQACTAARFGVRLNDKKLRILQKIAWMKVESQIASELQLFETLHCDTFKTLKLLLFGKTTASFGTFFARDAHENKKIFTPKKIEPLVTSREQLEALLELESFKEQSNPDFEELHSWLDAMRIQKFLACTHLEQRTGRYIEKVAKRYEMAGNLEPALELWNFHQTLASVHGRIRTLKKLNRGEQASQVARDMLAAENGGVISYYLKEVIHRKTNVKNATPRRLLQKEAPELLLQHHTGQGIEEDTCEQLRKQGIEAFHTENRIFYKLFTIFCETKLYEMESFNVVSPLGLPIYPYRTKLSESQRHLVERAIMSLDHSWIASIASSVQEDRPLALLLTHVPLKHIQSILSAISLAPHETLSGYPDLLTFDADLVKFVEVKGPTDTLRIEQLAALERMNNAGLTASVLRVRYCESIVAMIPKKRRQSPSKQYELLAV